jgi:hypothetical protein
MTAAPPNSAPRPTAAVCIGPALGDEVRDVAAEVAELSAEPSELVMLENLDERDEAASPVAVESSDDRLERALPASLVMEPMSDEASEVMDEMAELMTLESDAVSETDEVASVVVVVVSWACSGVLAKVL